MNSRALILSRTRTAKPAYVELENFNNHTPGTSSSDFISCLSSLHTHVIEIVNREDIYEYLYKEVPVTKSIFDGLNLQKQHVELFYDYAVVEAKLGVAENGAIWVDSSCVLPGSPAVLFSCEHLILVLQKGKIVDDMHAAYKALPQVGFGYGVFISGPSKTADIEQSLVIGAHGPKSLTVFLY